MNYTTTINDASVYGITAAREAYNASLPQTISVPSEVEGEPATEQPNPALIASDSGYLDFVLARAIESWCKMYAPVVVSPVPPVEVNGVPQTVSKRQAKTLMELTAHPAGNLWIAANEAAEAITDPAQRIITVNYLRDSQVYEYQRVLSMAQSLLGMTAEQVDQMFIAADKL